jgi:WD40 repeat protein/Flp pilus assembly protein TadD/tRNA A-37 threonylcarbamoyl transferase component Bud32
VLDSVIADYIRACEAGTSPRRREVLERHPEFAAELRQFFLQRDRMNQMAMPIRGFADDLSQSVGPGQQISYVGNYELLEEIARGGMGVVFRARQSTLGRIVAVKMIVSGRLATEQDVQRFQIEAKAAAGLQHPNIVSIHEVGQHEGWHYFSMDFVDGRDLSSLLRENVLPAGRAATYVRQIAGAIHFAHQQGTLHRDLKPSNILIDSHDQVRITDFGLAMRIEDSSELTRTGQIIGTPSYMPPEQAQGKRSLIGPGSDVYAIGAVLYECLTGRAPFRAGTVVETIQQVINVEAPSPRVLNPAIPRDLETICLKCLQKEPHRRYGTAQQLDDDLTRFLNGESIAARPVSAVERIWRWCRRKPIVAGLSGFSALAIATIILVLVYSRGVIAAALTDRTSALDELESEQAKTRDALRQETNALIQKTDALSRLSIEECKARDALVEKSAALKGERIAAYANTLTLSRREWLDGNLTRTLELLNTCHPDLRHWEWYYLRRLCEPASLYTALSSAGLSRGNRLPITSDAKTILVHHAATSAAEEVVVTNTVTGVMTPEFRLQGQPLGQLAVSDDGRVFMNGSSKMIDLSHFSYIELRDAQSGKSTFKADLPHFSLSTLAINPNGTQWAVSGSVWEPNAKSSSVQEVRIWTGHDSPPKQLTSGARSLVFSPDGKRLLTGHSTGLTLWDSLEYRKIADNSLEADFAPQLIYGVIPCFQRDSAQFAFAAGEFVAVCDASSGQKLRTFHLNQPGISAISYGRDDRVLAYGTIHGNVVLLDLQTGKQQVLLRLPKAVTQLEYSQDGLRLVTVDGNGQLQIWDTRVSPESEAIPGHAEHSFTATWDSSGKLVATIGRQNKARVWDVATRELKHEVGDSMLEVYEAQLSDDGTQLALAGFEGIEVRNLKTGAALHRFTKVDGAPMGFGDRVEFARQGNWLVGAHERGATIWNNVTGQEVRSFAVGKNSDWISSARLTADGGRLATCGHIGTLQLWDTKTGQELFRVEEENTLYTLTFSPDEKRIIACGLDNDILIVDAETGREIRRLSGHANGANTVAFSSDGKRLVSAGRDGVMKVWEAETGLELLSLETNPTTCYSAAFSPNSRYLVTTEIGILRIWDAGVDPEDPAVRRELASTYNALGADLRAKGKMLEAEQAYSQARTIIEKLVVDFPEVHLYRIDLLHSHWSLGALQLEDGRHVRAEQSFSQAIELSPDNSEVWLRRANFYTSQAQVGKAVSDYSKSLKLNPADPAVHNSLAWMLATCADATQRDPARSVELAKRAVELSSGTGEYWNTLGVAQYRVGDWQAAIVSLRKSIALREAADCSEFFFLALSCYQSGEMQMAREWYAKGVEWTAQHKPVSEEIQRFGIEAAVLLAPNAPVDR